MNLPKLKYPHTTPTTRRKTAIVITCVVPFKFDRIFAKVLLATQPDVSGRCSLVRGHYGIGGALTLGAFREGFGSGQATTVVQADMPPAADAASLTNVGIPTCGAWRGVCISFPTKGL